MIDTILSRREGMKTIEAKKSTIANKVLECLGNGAKTAEEIAACANISLNNARSRLTELAKQGMVETAGRKESPRSGVRITLWKIKK